jgi:hypothetical protein
MIGELVSEEAAEKNGENRKLNSSPLAIQATTPVAKLEHHDMNLCKR